MFLFLTQMFTNFTKLFCHNFLFHLSGNYSSLLSVTSPNLLIAIHQPFHRCQACYNICYLKASSTILFLFQCLYTQGRGLYLWCQITILSKQRWRSCLLFQMLNYSPICSMRWIHYQMAWPCKTADKFFPGPKLIFIPYLLPKIWLTWFWHCWF